MAAQAASRLATRMAEAAARRRAVLLRLVSAAAASYGKAMLIAYNATGGNDAFKIQDYQAIADDLTGIERFIHIILLAYGVGFIGSLVAINARWLVHLPSEMTKLALSKENNFFSNESQGAAQFVFGFPGLIVGFAIGLIPSVGVLGVVVAAPIAVFGVGVSVIRKLPLFVGIALSPIVMLFRLVREAYKYSRFSTEGLRFADRTPHTNQEVEQQKQKIEEQQMAVEDRKLFKALFSGVTAMGDLPVGEILQPAKDGPTYAGEVSDSITWKGFAKLLRKSITFNQRSLTELVLHEIHEGLTAAAKNRGVAVNVNELIQQALARVRLTYETDSQLLTPQSEKDRNNLEVTQIADYVSKILAQRTLNLPVPELYNDNVSRDLFFSQHAAVDGVPVVRLANA